MMFGETGGSVGVSVWVGASVKAVAVSEGVSVKTSVFVADGRIVATCGVALAVEVTNTGVGERIEGVIVGGGAGKVGT